MILNALRFGLGAVILLFLFCWNLRRPRRLLCVVAVFTVALGLLCNVAVIFSNGGKMPVSGYYQPWTVEDGVHTLLRPTHRLQYLADIHGPEYVRYSVGDVVATAGLVMMFGAVVWYGRR